MALLSESERWVGTYDGTKHHKGSTEGILRTRVLQQRFTLERSLMQNRFLPPYGPGLPGMLAAGLVGITVNTAILKLAPLLHIHPGSGGLLQLLLLYAQRSGPGSLIALHSLGLRKPPSLAGFLWFHYVTGMTAILVYFYLFAKHVRGARWWRATVFALLFWLINAGLVLPQLGEGFAGIRAVSPSGVLYFCFANWVFVVVSALSYRCS